MFILKKIYNNYLNNLVEEEMIDTGFNPKMHDWKYNEIYPNMKKAFSLFLTLLLIIATGLVVGIYLLTHQTKEVVPVVQEVKSVEELSKPMVVDTKVDINKKFGIRIPRHILENIEGVVEGNFIQEEIVKLTYTSLKIDKVLNYPYYTNETKLETGDVLIKGNEFRYYIGKGLVIIVEGNKYGVSKKWSRVNEIRRFKDVVTVKDLVHTVSTNRLIKLKAKVKELDLPINRLTINLLNEMGAKHLTKFMVGEMDKKAMRNLLPHSYKLTNKDFLKYWRKRVSDS